MPEITSLAQMQAILNTHLEDYTLQASSSYGEAALGVEVEEAKALKGGSSALILASNSGGGYWKLFSGIVA